MHIHLSHFEKFLPTRLLGPTRLLDFKISSHLHCYSDSTLIRHLRVIVIYLHVHMYLPFHVFFQKKLYHTHWVHFNGFFPSWTDSICLLKYGDSEMVYYKSLHHTGREARKKRDFSEFGFHPLVHREIPRA